MTTEERIKRAKEKAKESATELFKEKPKEFKEELDKETILGTPENLIRPDNENE